MSPRPHRRPRRENPGNSQPTKSHRIFDQSTLALLIDPNAPPHERDHSLTHSLNTTVTYSLLAICLFISVTKLSADEISLADLIERTESACVRVDVKYKDGSRGIGSGFIVDADRKWVVKMNYRASLSDSGGLLSKESVSGEAERLKVTGKSDAEKILGELLSDMVNKLNLESLFQQARQ